MQTHEWEELLDGATEGPWKWHWDGGLLTITDPNGKVIAIDAEVKDSDLIAAAPEAVAEVVRLRREVAAFRDQMTESAEKHKAMHDRHRDLDHLLAAEYDDQIAYVLTSILEGDSDE